MIFVVHVVICLIAALTKLLWFAVLRSLGYLSGTVTRALFLSAYHPLTLQAYSDSY